MGGCSICGEDGDMDYSCNYCSGNFCSTHRLPENHNCPGLRNATSQGPDFRSHEDGSSMLGSIFGRDDGTDGESIARESHPGMKTYDGDLDLEGRRGQKAAPGSASYEPESSPDVASDGSNVRKDASDQSSGGVYSRGSEAVSLLIGVVLWPFFAIYDGVLYLIGFLSSILSRPVPLFLLLGGGVIAAHLLGVIDLPVDAAMGGVSSVLSAAGNGTAGAAETPDSGGSQSGYGAINRSQVEVNIHAEINEERDSRGLPQLQWDSNLQEIARYHSKEMANGEFFSHTSPDSQTRGDRYDRFGYNCRVSTSGNRYLTGAENIAKTYHHKNVIGQGRLTTEQEVAEAIVEGWMDSEGHRENILTRDWNNEGIGVHLTSDNAVYVTQNFC